MMKVIYDSGWRGAIGVLSHRVEFDAAETLRKNLEGYDRLLARLKNPPPAKAPAQAAPKAAAAVRFEISRPKTAGA